LVPAFDDLAPFFEDPEAFFAARAVFALFFDAERLVATVFPPETLRPSGAPEEVDETKAFARGLPP
jgi:hypothetical protein